MNRRKYLASFGSAVTAGLAGCMDMVRSNEEDEEDHGDSNTGDGFDDDDDLGEVDTEGVEVDFFTTSVDCTDSPDETQFISSPEDNKTNYDFNGQVIAPTSCHDAIASARLEDNTLVVDLNIMDPDIDCGLDCTGLISYAGNVNISDDLTGQIQESEIQIT